jgi:hypothetical protein
MRNVLASACFLAAVIATLTLASCGGKVIKDVEGAGGQGGSGGVCGAVTCGPNETCVYADHLCGKADVGQCAEFPASCGEDNSFYCGCDGAIHTQCDLASLHIDNTGLGSCTWPAGFFQCGSHLCNGPSQVCQTFAGTGEAYCLPASCGGAPTCECALQNPPCVNATCDMTAGGVTIHCLS